MFATRQPTVSSSSSCVSARSDSCLGAVCLINVAGVAAGLRCGPVDSFQSRWLGVVMATSVSSGAPPVGG